MLPSPFLQDQAREGEKRLCAWKVPFFFLSAREYGMQKVTGVGLITPIHAHG